MELDERLLVELAKQPYPCVFLTVTGAHMFGFPSSDSDYDVRGAHILPAQEVLGLGRGRETIEVSRMCDGLELDLVTHDVKVFFELILKKNGNVLEQVLSPLVVQSSPEHEELKGIVRTSLTKHHYHHYRGFAEAQWKLFENESPRRVKPLLYVYRLLLFGIHLMRTGKVESNLVRLNEGFKLPYVTDLVARKTGGPERGTLDDKEFGFYRAEYERLTAEMREANRLTHLPDEPAGAKELNALLIRLRMKMLRA